MTNIAVTAGKLRWAPSRSALKNSTDGVSPLSLTVAVPESSSNKTSITWALTGANSSPSKSSVVGRSKAGVPSKSIRSLLEEPGVRLANFSRPSSVRYPVT